MAGKMGKKNRGQKTDNRKQKKWKWKGPFKIPRFLIPKDEPITPRAFALLDYAGGILVFFICWAVYLHTLTPTVGFHDSGDMITVTYVLGIPHPTGYPLYCLLGKLWMTILPIGNIAYRMNLASALCASLACMMVYFIVLKVVGGGRQEVVKYHLLHPASHIPAAVAALMLAFATTFWEQAVIAEKYTLNALFATLLIFILLKWAEAMSTEHRAWSMEVKAQSSRLEAQNYLYLFAFTLGLSFTHHMQTIYLVPASVFFILLISITSWMKKKTHVKAKKTIRQNNKQFLFNILYLLKSIYKKLLILRPVLIMFFLFIIPLLLYSYLPLRASQNPPVNWSNPDNLERFINHITAKDYKMYMSSTIQERIDRLKYHFSKFFTHQFTPLLLWLCPSGALFLIIRNINFFILFLLIFLTNLCVASSYTIYNVEDYYLPSFGICAILSGCGIIGITQIIYLGFAKISNYSGTKIVHLFPIIFLPLLLIPFNTNYKYANRNNHHFAYDYGRNILFPLEENSIAFLRGDMNIFPLFYLQVIERWKPMIAFIDNGFLHNDWYAEQIKEKRYDLKFELYPKEKIMKLKSNAKKELIQVRIEEVIERNINNFPVYTFFDEAITHFAKDYSLISQGLFWRVVGDKKDKDKFLKRGIKLNIRGRMEDIIDDGLSLAIGRTKGIFENYAVVYSNWGSLCYKKGRYKKAIENLKKAIEINPNFSGAYLNLGIVYNKLQKYDIAITYFKKTIGLTPKNSVGYMELGYTYIDKRQYDKAIIEFEKAVTLEPKNIDYHLTLAETYYKKGDINNTCKTLEKLLELVPFRDDIRQALLAIRHGKKIAWD
ncbi:MAG: DUF2723 domain-containing protein [bacterium]